MAEEPKASPEPSAAAPKKSGFSFKKAILVVVGVAILLLLGYRWAGTSTVRVTVQRVYEDQGDFRAELVQKNGEVLVVANHDMKFPHFKLDSADKHAELHNLVLNQDVADVTVWGFRFTWMDMFPNVVDVHVVQTNQERRKALADRLATAVLEHLREKGAVPAGAGLHAGTVEVIESVLAQEPGRPTVPRLKTPAPPNPPPAP